MGRGILLWLLGVPIPIIVLPKSSCGIAQLSQHQPD
jgi:hypothetical protein